MNRYYAQLEEAAEDADTKIERLETELYIARAELKEAWALYEKMSALVDSYTAKVGAELKR